MKVVFFIYCLLLVGLSEVKTLKLEVIKEIPRAKRGFTQGFFILDGKLYESTGGYGSSLVRRFDLETQKVELSKALPKNIFGEGLTAFGENEMVQITWKAGLGVVYDRESIDVLKTFRYSTEGWGITAKGKKLIMSDGSDKLFHLDPNTFQVTKEISVTKDGKPVDMINELEWVGEEIYANIWLTDEIIRINPEDGKVTGIANCSHLYKERSKDQSAVLNGIAYDHNEKVFYLTGKKWGVMYKVKFTE